MKYTFQVRDAFIALSIAVSMLVAVTARPATTPFNTLAQSVVRLTDLSANRGGTGFVIRSVQGKTFLVSNWHVCEDSTKGYMLAVRDGEFELKVRVLKVSPAHDLCILEAVPGKALKLGHPAKELQELFELGHPWLGHQTPAQGRLISARQDLLMFDYNGMCPAGMAFTITPAGQGCLAWIDLIDTTIEIAPGNSGSPVTNSEGEVVGVINSMWGPRGNGAMISVKYLRQLLESS